MTHRIFKPGDLVTFDYTKCIINNVLVYACEASSKSKCIGSIDVHALQNQIGEIYGIAKTDAFPENNCYFVYVPHMQKYVYCVAEFLSTLDHM